ncbi:MAG TPA: DUF1569 domain-containing protein [Vicinamibacterales bacterium]|jgi:hypothetical protein|nr:DUF1569 domain-containing protein [Vicinamibacterales bacterium]
MTKTIFDPVHRDELVERLNRLTPDAKAQWGKMTAARMLCHLSDSLRVASGEIPAKFHRGPLANPIVRWLMAYVVPFPRGKAETAPEMLVTKPADWYADLSTARELLRVAAQRGPDGQWARHPAFGDMSGALNGVFIYKHVDHHLRQFGV